MRLRLLMFLALAVAATAVLAACGSDDGDGGSGSDEPKPAAAEAPAIELPPLPTYDEVDVPEPEKPYEMYMLVPHQFETVLKSFTAAAKEEAKKYNVKLTIQDAGGYQNADKQVNQFENAIASKPDAIIVFAANADGLNSQVEKAVSQGIKVIGAVTGPSSDKVDVSIDDDLNLQGEQMALALANKLNSKGKIFMFVGGAGSPFNRDVKAGAKAGLGKAPDIEVAVEKDLPAFNPADAQQAAEAAIAGHPDVGGLFASTIPEAQAAARATGKDDIVAVATAIETKKDLDLLREGKITAVGVTAATIGGKWSIDYALKLLAGEEVAKKIPLPPALVTSDNVDEAIDSGVMWNWVSESVLK